MLRVRSDHPAKSAEVKYDEKATVSDFLKGVHSALKLEKAISHYHFSSVDYLKDIVSLDSSQSKTLKESGVNGSSTILLSLIGKKTKPRVEKTPEPVVAGELPAGVTEDNIFSKIEGAKGGTKEALLKWLDKNAKKAFESKNFKKAPKSVLVEVIQRDGLALKEVVLFDYIVAWVEANGKKTDGKTVDKKTEMAPFVPHIRFPLMKAAELASKVVPTGILASDLVLELFTFVARAEAGAAPELKGGLSKMKATKRKTGGLTWDGTTPMGGVRIEEDGAIIHSLPFTGENTSCKTVEGWTEGKHSWEIHFLSIGSTSSFRAGFITNRFVGWQQSGFAIGNDSGYQSAGFWSGSMAYGGFTSASGSAPTFSVGTVLVLTLDLTAREFRAGQKGAHQNAILRDLPAGITYYPGITFYDRSAPCRIKIVEVEE